MLKSKFIKACLFGICTALLSSGALFASSQSQDILQNNRQIQLKTDNVILQKQAEIDQYIFESHVEEIARQGFIVTHTGPMETYVEIGIMPYSEDNANYLYEIFGREVVKVVEGRQAVLLPMPIGDVNLDNMDSHTLEQNVEISSQDIQIQVNGEYIQMDGVPVIENRGTLIPMRSVMERLGATVNWNPEDTNVEIVTEDTIIVLPIGNSAAKITRIVDGVSNEEIIGLDVPAKIINEHTFIPVRFIAETLGATVGWNEERRIVTIKTVQSNHVEDEIGPSLEEMEKLLHIVS